MFQAKYGSQNKKMWKVRYSIPPTVHGRLCIYSNIFIMFIFYIFCSISNFLKSFCNFYEKLLLHLTHCFSFIMQQKIIPIGNKRTPAIVYFFIVYLMKFPFAKSINATSKAFERLFNFVKHVNPIVNC